MGEEERGRNRVRGCLSLAIVWTQFLSHCIDHRQGVAEGAPAGNIRGGTWGDTVHCIFALCADSEQEGGWSQESVAEKELG